MRSTNILIFLVALNASAVVLGAAGVSQSVGYDPVFPLATPLYLLVGIDILQIISGRDLT